MPTTVPIPTSVLDACALEIPVLVTTSCSGVPALGPAGRSPGSPGVTLDPTGTRYLYWGQNKIHFVMGRQKYQQYQY